MPPAVLTWSSWGPRNHLRFRSVLILFLLFLIGNGEVQADTSEDINKYLQYTDALKNFWYQTLNSLYKLSQQFIVTITPKGIIQDLIFKGFNFSDPEDFIKKLNLQNIQNFFLSQFSRSSFGSEAATTGAGYIVIVGLGIIMTVFFLLSCLFTCCCRKIGCCCGKVADNDPKSSDVPLIVVLYILVASLSVLLFLSAYGSIVSGVVAADVLKNDDESGLPLVGKVMPFLRNVTTFINSTFEEILNAINMTELPDLSAKLINFTKDEIKSLCPSCSSLIDGYKNLTAYAKKVSPLLDGINKTQTYLNGQYADFNLTLEDFKNRTLQVLTNCNEAECNDLRQNLSFFILLRHSIQDTSATSLNSALNNEILNGNNDLFGNFSSFSNKFSELVKTFLQTATEQLNTYMNLATSYLNINNYLNTISSSLASVRSITDVIPVAMKGVAIAVGAILILICLLNVIGLILGPVCIKKGPKTSEKIYMASSQISFSVGSTLCVLCVILFLVGAPVYREVCLDVRKESNSTYFQLADRIVQYYIQNQSDRLKFPNSNVSLNIDIKNFFIITKTVEQECAKNRGLLDALLDFIIFDNETANGIVDSLIPCITCQFNLSTLPIFDNATIDQLKGLAGTIKNQSISLPVNDSTPLFTIALETIKNSMKNAENKVSDKATLNNLTDIDLNQINNTANNITMEEKKQFRDVKELNDLIGNISQLLLEIVNYSLDARTNLANISGDSNSKLEQDLKNFIRELILDFYNIIRGKLSKVAQCRNLYNAFNFIFQFFCDLIIYPVNAYWFSLGSGITLLIPGFLAGLWLGGLIARRHKTYEDYVDEDDEEEDFEKPSRDTDGDRQQLNNRQAFSQNLAVAAPSVAPPKSPPAASDQPRSAGNAPFNDSAFENSSLYYIPAFPNTQPTRPNSNYRPSDPYYNMPYLRVPQFPQARPITGMDMRIPRPWGPINTRLAQTPYSRF